MTNNLLNLFCLVDGEGTSNAFSVKIPSADIDNDKLPVLLDNVTNNNKKLGPETRLSKVISKDIPEETVHIIVQRPPPVHAPVPSPALTPLPGSLSDGSRPGTPLSGDLHADIKRITDKFFAPEPIADVLGAFMRGKKKLPVAKGSIRGLPSAWHRGFGKAPETRPSLLFMDLPDPSTPDSSSRNLAAGSILEPVKENN
ncbi:hypothetical protein BGX30_002958 [Mortierella sp. GBA39]|nr:hypothetical protein BGX30_002958 [Mortierella sp. GBA39]